MAILSKHPCAHHMPLGKDWTLALAAGGLGLVCNLKPITPKMAEGVRAIYQYPQKEC